jgi:hypothetical protein
MTTKILTTKSGKQSIITSVKKAPATLKKAIADAAHKNLSLRWTVRGMAMDGKSDIRSKRNLDGHLPTGWSAQTLIDRINNPESGDSWKAGDVNGALVSIALAQNSSQVTSISSIDQYDLNAY